MSSAMMRTMLGRPRAWADRADARSAATITADEDWIDPRAPDGVTILAPYEQAHPSEHPGVFGGDTWEEHALFDLQVDPSEQNNVAEEHPDVVSRLRARFDAMNEQVGAS